MKIYFAPMEGVSGYIYRQVYHKHFKAFDRYFTPFIAPTQNKKFSSKALKDILPENNVGMDAIPQILTNKVDQFLFTSQALEFHGYKLVNLNLGCPSQTVVSKNKGSGFLKDLDQLDRFLYVIYNEAKIQISIKTRLGLESPEEFQGIMKIYNQYPLEELIIHPRTQKDYYKNTPHLDVFNDALSNATMPICYNGDIFSRADYKDFIEKFGSVDRIMFGRGVLGNPNLLGDILGQEALRKDKLKAFHDDLVKAYEGVMYGEKPVLFKMKELWFYMIHLFENPYKSMKAIRKSQSLSAYREIIDRLFKNHDLVSNQGFFHDAIKGIKNKHQS